MNDFAYCVALNQNDDIFIAGYFMSDTIYFDSNMFFNTQTPNPSKYDFYIAKYDKLGNNIWTKTNGTLNTEQIKSIALDSTGNIFATGYYTQTFNLGNSTLIWNPNNISSGTGDAFIAKLNDNFSTTTFTHEIIDSEVKIFPNPSYNETNILLERNLYNATIQIESTLGKIVYLKINFTGSSFVLNNLNLEEGVYFIKIFEQNNLINSNKLVIQNKR